MNDTMGRLVLMTVLALPVAARAQDGLTPAEIACQAHATGIAIGSYVERRASILIDCERDARRGTVPRSDCRVPYGGATSAALAAAHQRAAARSVSFCPDCPECYSGGDCVADAAAKIGRIDGLIDAFKPLVYCNDAPTTDGEAACQATVGHALATMVRRMSRATAACKLREYRGETPLGACDPTDVQDAINLEANRRAQTHAAALIDRACGAPPACFAFPTGARWVAFAVPVSYSPYADLYCVDP